MNMQQRSGLPSKMGLANNMDKAIYHAAALATFAFPIVAKAAWHKMDITYADLAMEITKAAAVPCSPRELGMPLGMICDWCLSNGMPPLNVIVVRNDIGVPGDGCPVDYYEHKDAVYQFDWYRQTYPKGLDFLQRHVREE
jgi:hypothetical protein